MRRTREERDHDDAGIELIDDEAALSQYPPLSDYPIRKGTEITIGDLHGNALKFLYFLIRENILLVDPIDYGSFVKIYWKKTDLLTQEDIRIARHIIDHAQCATLPKGVKIRLLGDELADRGSNDYFTLLIMFKISQLSQQFEILFSNHGYEFLQVFEHGLKTHYSYMEQAGCADSLTNMRLLLERRLISMREINYLVREGYLPYLQLLSHNQMRVAPHLLQRIFHIFFQSSYPSSEKVFVLYSHAWIGLKTIIALKRHPAFRASFQTRIRFPLEAIIDLVNKRFHEIVMQGAVVRYFEDEIEKKAVYDLRKIPFIYAVLRCVWERGYTKEQPTSHVTYHGTSYRLFYVHGHDGCGNVPVEFRRTVINLDNIFGKGKSDAHEKYTVLYTQSA